jgi:group II intron reverse transcriptase/maturase
VLAEETSVDSDERADEAWLLGVQRKLYQWSRNNPESCYRELWNWVTDLRNLRRAWRKIAGNKGSRTAGIDGMTVMRIRNGEGSEAFLVKLRDELRTGRYRPSPCRRKLIPKLGQPGKFRPLGIPTVADRVVQDAVKNLLEPIFEAHFWHVSYGALEHIRMAIRPRAKASDGRRQRGPYQWVIEGDIKGCFDHIDHHLLMERIRARIGDLKVTKLVRQFLRAGVLEEGFLLPTTAGTPQGGVISPLLANIALSAIEERYERWVHHRQKIRAHRTSDGVKAAREARMSDRRRGVPVFFPIRYADDFVILVSGTREQAEHEITDLTEGIEFLGHRVRLKWHRRFGLMPRIETPKLRQADLRYRVKQVTRRATINRGLSALLQKLNPILRGWGNFYRFCTGAGQRFASLDHYVGDRLWRWLMKKHGSLHRKRSTIRRLPSLVRPTRTVWRERRTEQFLLASLRVERFRRGWMRPPAFAMVPGEPDA